jgi:hypothetical protein
MAANTNCGTASEVVTPDRASGDWVMVPREPTEEMLAAIRGKWHPTRPDGWDARHRHVYQTMLSASPVAPREEKLREALAELVAATFQQMTLHGLSAISPRQFEAANAARALLEDEK